MELLLNLAWLLLAVPAWWLWRGRKGAPKFSSLQCLLALGCALVVLFPVISATDDLRAMRAEMEESPTCKRGIRQASNDKASAWNWQSVPALAGTTSSPILNDEGWQQMPASSVCMPVAPAIEQAGRAPPDSFLG